MQNIIISCFAVVSIHDQSFYAALCNLLRTVVTAVGSKYYENEKRKDKQIEDRIARQKEELDRITDQQKAVALLKVTLVLN